MKNRTVFYLLTCLAFACTAHAEKWSDPEVFRINKESAHAEFTVYANRADAIKPLDLTNPWQSEAYQSLNGKWDFNWYPNLDEVPEGWYKSNPSVSEWNSIPVPGSWQTYGYDRLYYLNTMLPFFYDYETKKQGLRKEFTGGEPVNNKRVVAGFVPREANPVGCYRKWVDLPEERLKQRVVLRIGAVEAGVGIYVNGEEVGYSQDSLTPAEFNITPHLKPGKNLLALQVYRWTDGSYLEMQDMIRFAGIYRDVFLRFEPLQRIRDISFVGTPDETLKKINIAYNVDIENHSRGDLGGAKIDFELLSSTDTVHTWSQPVSSVFANGSKNVQGKLVLNNLKLWSPDQPNLYTLLASLKDAAGNVLQVVRIDTGFRRFEDRKGNLYLNGKRFFIKGVNRHDHHPKFGRHVTLESMIRDLELMKQNNINTVRTSHYPNDERWYYLCNRYGMALLDEANVESHAVSMIIPQDYPQWIPQAVDRIVNVVERDKNHPSVFIWSLGNEQGVGWCKTFEEQYTAAKKLDPTRMVMCDRGNKDPNRDLWDLKILRADKPDFVTPMYGALSHMKEHVEMKKDQRPFFMCEYRHAMGNSVGALKEVWDYIYAHENDRLNGGCIWDWVDQGVEATNENGTVYYQYGGDWGDERQNRDNFSMNGLVLSNREGTPKLAEVKKCYEPFMVKAISLEQGTFSIHNRLNQTGLEQFNIFWELRENGAIVQSEEHAPLTVSPGEMATFTIPFDRSRIDDAKEYFLRIAFKTSHDTVWAKAGHEVTFSEFYLGGRLQIPVPASPPAPKIVSKDETITVSTDNGLVCVFDKANGALSSLSIQGTELMADAASQTYRPFDHDLAAIDNYFKNGRWALENFAQMQLGKLAKKEPSSISATIEKNKAVVCVSSSFRSPKGSGFDEIQTWEIDGAGRIEVTESVTPAGRLDDHVWVPRIGVRFPLSATLDQVAYYGKGPHGNYVDRSYGTWMDIHKSSVRDWFVPYGKPQDHGNREGVRWMKLADSNGRGLKIIAPEPLSMSVLPYTQEELRKARHTVDLPVSTITDLRIAAKVSGVGNGSCGPITDVEHQAFSAPVEYRFILIPFTP